MASQTTKALQRYPATLHQGAASKQIEVAIGAQAFTLYVEGKKKTWPFAETKYSSGGVPRFERGEELLIVPEFKIVDAITTLNPQALSQMEQTNLGVFTAKDFATGLMAVLIVMGGAMLLVAVLWYFRK